jgi:hypothetical protein
MMHTNDRDRKEQRRYTEGTNKVSQSVARESLMADLMVDLKEVGGVQETYESSLLP